MFLPCPVVSVRGTPKEEALANIRETIALYLEPIEDEQILTEKAEVIELSL